MSAAEAKSERIEVCITPSMKALLRGGRRFRRYSTIRSLRNLVWLG